MELNFIQQPEKQAKPRKEGLTIIHDDGLSLNAMTDLISTSGDYIDFVRLSVGALLSNEKFETKIDTYKKASMHPFVDGIILESAYLKNKVTVYFNFLKQNQIEYIEISDSIIDISSKDKAKLIKEASKHFNVISKVGPKQKNVFFSFNKWKEYIVTDIDAGAQYVIIEGGEGGTLNNISGKIDININLVKYLAKITDSKTIIWEARQEEQQVWFFDNYGIGVNLADITPDDVLRLESQRQSLHWQTFKNAISDSELKSKLKQVDPRLGIDFQI